MPSSQCDHHPRAAAEATITTPIRTRHETNNDDDNDPSSSSATITSQHQQHRQESNDDNNSSSTNNNNSSTNNVPWFLIVLDLICVVVTILTAVLLLCGSSGTSGSSTSSILFGCFLYIIVGVVSVLTAVVGSVLIGVYYTRKYNNNNNINERRTHSILEDEDDDDALLESNNDLTTPLLSPSPVAEVSTEISPEISSENDDDDLQQDIQEEEDGDDDDSEQDENDHQPSRRNRTNRNHTRSLPEIDLDAAKGLAQLDHTISSWRNGIFVVAYVILTAISFGLGVEAVIVRRSNSNGDDDSNNNNSSSSNNDNDDDDDSNSITGIDVAYIAIAIASLQATYFLSKRIVSRVQSRSEIRLMLGAVHVHPIRLQVERYDASCDICSEEIKNGEAFRCKLCDFDYCMVCFRKSKRSQDWGLLRGDKGIKVPDRVRSATMGTYLLRSLGLLKPYALYVLITASCLLFNVVCRLFVPNVEGGLFDDLIVGHGGAFMRRVRILAAYRIGQTIFQSIQRYFVRIISRRMRCDLRMRLFERLLAQDIAFFDATRAGAMARRVDGDVADMTYPVPLLVNTVLQSLVLMVGAVICCLVSSARLTVLSAACIGPMVYLTRVSAEWAAGLEGQKVTCEEEGNAAITEAMSNIRNVRALSAERHEAKRYRRVISRLLRKMEIEAAGDMLVENIEGALEFLVEYLVLAFGGLAIIHGHQDALSVGQLIAFTMYWEMVIEGVDNIQDMFSDLAQASGAAQRVFDLLDIHPDIPLADGTPLDRQSFRGHIRFENVNFAYQTRREKPVLKGFDLDIPAGGTCALVGKSRSL